jgi:hypothetical protein
MPKQRSGILGIDKVMSNLRHELKKIEGRSVRGISEAMGMLERDMDDNDPKVPIDTGNLRGSWFANVVKQADGTPAGIMGFSANYAIFVHENVDADFTSPRWRYRKGEKRKWYTPREGSGAKFFEKALYRNKARILEIIRKHAKI